MIFKCALILLAIQNPLRTIAIDARLAADARLKIGDTVTISAQPNLSSADKVVIGAITERATDPSEIARGDYKVRLHLDQLQSLANYGDRVDRFAVLARNGGQTVKAINASAFGFRAHNSKDIAVETSRTFQVVNRFHKAIGVITIAASAIFLLCIMLLKVDERRRDVAVMRMMGISRKSIVKSIVVEASAIALLGSVLGVAIGLISARLVNLHYQAVYRTPLLFALVTKEIIILSVVLSLVLGIGAGLMASIKLVRTEPLKLFGR